MIFDFTGVQDSYEPVPAGPYQAEVVEIQPGTSKSGNQKLTIRFKITGPEHAGRTVFFHGVLGAKGAWKTKEAMKALGLLDGDKAAVKPSTVVGRKATIEVEVWAREDGTNDNSVNKVTAPNMPY